MNKKPNLFNQVIISSIEDYKNKIETLTKQKERLIRRDKKHREEIERLNNIIDKAIKCINDYAIEDEDYSKIYNQEEQELLKILKGSDKE